MLLLWKPWTAEIPGHLSDPASTAPLDRDPVPKVLEDTIHMTLGWASSGLLEPKYCLPLSETKEATLIVSELPLGSFLPCLEEYHMTSGN